METILASSSYRSQKSLNDVLHLERMAFAAKTRAARAVLGLSQRRFAELIGLTQKSVHRIEHGAVDPSMRTVVRIETFWRANGVRFEETPDAGFRLIVDAAVLRAISVEPEQDFAGQRPS